MRGIVDSGCRYRQGQDRMRTLTYPSLQPLWFVLFKTNKRGSWHGHSNTYIYTDGNNVDTYHSGVGTHLLWRIQILWFINFCGGITFTHIHAIEKGFFLDGAMSCNSVWPYMFMLTTTQWIVETHRSVVTSSRCAPSSATESASSTTLPQVYDEMTWIMRDRWYKFQYNQFLMTWYMLFTRGNSVF